MAVGCRVTSSRLGLIGIREVDDIEGVMLLAEEEADAEYRAGETGAVRVKAVAVFPARGGAEYGTDTYTVECKRG